MFDGAKIVSYIDLHHPSATHLHECVSQCPQSLMRVATRPICVRAVQKILLVYWFQEHHYRALKHLILEGWNAQRTLLPVAFRNVRPLHRWCSVASRLRAFQQVLEVALEILAVFGCRLLVYSCCAILPRISVGL